MSTYTAWSAWRSARCTAAPCEAERRRPAVWRAALLRQVGQATPGAARALARQALDPEAPLNQADLDGPLAMLDRRADCDDFEAVSLVHLW
ncbi:hypothetical protein ACIPX0_45305 [Streptomyces sp. NPDC090075]|uniref:hypothetical protein n=1 Tax=Streptomyces sp. NPDC090075 TaxID=3365937 RepID=UPI00380A0267